MQRSISTRFRWLAVVASCGLLMGGCVIAPPYGPHVRGDVVVGVAPMPGFIWFDGYWSHDYYGRHWHPGHWGQPQGRH